MGGSLDLQIAYDTGSATVNLTGGSMINMDNTLKKWNRMTDAARERQLTRMVVQSEITYMPKVLNPITSNERVGLASNSLMRCNYTLILHSLRQSLERNWTPNLLHSLGYCKRSELARNETEDAGADFRSVQGCIDGQGHWGLLLYT